ncbi:MAG: YpdA family putative bacillithiol disulfide reductase [Bacteroidetes bacterium]|nr:MAG: YpdA family putative bacillithiol disulfide reductase [Bacteroidota bacterium]
MFDLVIIGAGPIGLACGIEAQKAGLSYVILEKGYLVNSIYHYPHSMTFFSTADKIEIGKVPFISQNVKPNRSEALEYYRRVAMVFNLNIHLQEEVFRIIKLSDHFTLESKREAYNAKRIVIATGFYDHANAMNIPGENLPKVQHYYQDAHPFFKRHVAVIGAANSAVDAALELFRKGAESVSIIIRESEISERVKYWVRPDIINRIKEGSIKAYFESECTRIEAEYLYIQQAGQELKLKNDNVLALTGYKPDYKLLIELGLQFSDDAIKQPIYNSETMESNIAGLYLAGVICGGMQTNKWFIENSRGHAGMIIKHILTQI